MLRALATLLALLTWLPQAYASIGIDSARIWPAQDYTRLTLETRQPVKHNMFSMKNPARLVIDIEDIEIGKELNTLPSLVNKDDPYISSVRIGRFKPGIVRLVLDLKAEVNPQLFSLKPVKDYGHRLVLDVYPTVAPDPMMALLDRKETAGATPATGEVTIEDIIAKQAAPETIAPDKNAAPGKTATAQAPAPAAPPAISQPAIAQKGKVVAKFEPTVTEAKPAVPEMRARTLIVAIDAGHGGEDPGAIGKKGTKEKDVTLAVARKLKKQVDALPNMRAVLIRDGDYFIPLGTRVAKARKAHADLFISIHADAFIKRTARGSSVFALSEHGATSTAARWLAKKENEADLIGGVNIAVNDPYLARTLLDLSQTATINDSMKLAKHVLGELGDINKLHRGHVEQAGFAVLKSPDIPSILVETAFISNPDEENRLRDDDYQDKLAGAILGGVNRYFSQNPALSRQNIAQADN